MKMPKDIAKELEGIPYQLIPGGKHQKLYVDGSFVGVIPFGGRSDDTGGRGKLNIRAQVRRAVRAYNFNLVAG